MAKISNSDLIQKYVPLVDFIADVLGTNSEVVLHDLTNLNHSVIAIRNSYISNREVGAPVTDLALQIYKENSHKNNDFITNYCGMNKFNKKLRCSTFFIRNDSREIIGLLCVNTDESVIVAVEQALAAFTSVYGKNVSKPSTQDVTQDVTQETLPSNIEELVESSIQKITSAKGITINYLNQDDKLEITEDLYDKGIFLVKGAVVEVAKTMMVSEATIYRYLSKIKSKKETMPEI